MNQTPNDRHRVDDLASTIIDAHTVARDLARATFYVSDLDLARNLTRDLHLARDLDLARTRAWLLGPGLTSDLAHARDLASDLFHTRDLNIARTRARELERVLRAASKKAAQLRREYDERQQPTANSAVWASRQVEPRRVAARMAELATKVLPVAHRARYRDEYRSELYELATANASWWQQMMYAVRLLNRSWELRYELRQPAARRARS